MILPLSNELRQQANVLVINRPDFLGAKYNLLRFLRENSLPRRHCRLPFRLPAGAWWTPLGCRCVVVVPLLQFLQPRFSLKKSSFFIGRWSFAKKFCFALC